MIPARKRSRMMNSKLTTIAMTSPLERAKKERVKTRTARQVFSKQTWGGKTAGAKNSHQDPVPGLCVVFKDLHDSLASFNDHRRISVERQAVSLATHAGVIGLRCKVNTHTHTHSLDSIYKVFGVSHVSISIIKLRVIPHCDHTSFLTQGWETPPSD